MMRLNRHFLLSATLLCGVLVFAGCGGSSSTTTTSSSTGDKIGVAECDEYIEKMEACLSKMPEASRGASKSAFEASRKAWKDGAANADSQAKAVMATSCKQALDAAKQAFTAFGCTW